MDKINALYNFLKTSTNDVKIENIIAVNEFLFRIGIQYYSIYSKEEFIAHKHREAVKIYDDINYDVSLTKESFGNTSKYLSYSVDFFSIVEDLENNYEQVMDCLLVEQNNFFIIYD